MRQSPPVLTDSVVERYRHVRERTVNICAPLATEDYVVQPIADVSPPKWHLGHTTWFFETFVLKSFLHGYKEFNKQFNWVFNSYYETVGARVIRTDRGNLSRPSVEEVFRYRDYVDEHMRRLLTEEHNNKLSEIVELGLNHEQQHQELLYTDIKYILGHNPLFPAFPADAALNASPVTVTKDWHDTREGIYEIGFQGAGFSFDNERERHKVYLQRCSVSKDLVTNAEYLEFIKSGGYDDFRHWHAEGWEWVQQNKIKAPLYWHLIDGIWMNYTFDGLAPVALHEPVCHINYYEACAYASWKDKRLPTEAEWEVASDHFHWGQRWEWTGSAYLPYPGFRRSPGAIGEYNGKFMVNQMVLRGASVATPEGHSRKTYRNFFHAHDRWQFMGIRLAE